MAQNGSSVLQTDQEIWERALEPLVDDEDLPGTLFRLKGLPEDQFPLVPAVIGRLYEYGGKGLPHDFLKAREYYEQALSKGPYVLAIRGLGRIYFYGKGVEKNLDTAECYFDQLSENGYARDFLMLGKIHYIRDRDIDTAKAFFKKAADRGNLIADKHLSEIAIEEGHVVSGYLQRIRSLAKILFVYIQDKHDERLEQD